MSAYITHLTPMIEQDCLLAALADVGISRQKVEVHAQPVALVGYEGQQRQQSAHLVIRRQHIGSASNDLGFLFSPTGYKAIISDYDNVLILKPIFINVIHDTIRVRVSPK